MVLGVVMMATMLPTMIGLNEATQGSRDQEENRRTTERKQRVHLVATCSLSQGTPELRQQIQNAKVYVGLDGKFYMTKHPSSSMVPFNGGFYQHPDFPPNNTSGMVTISGEETPHTSMGIPRRPNARDALGWPPRQSRSRIWTKDEQFVTLDGWEGWLAVRLSEDEARDRSDQELGIVDGQELWRLYFDKNDDGADLPPGAQGLEIQLKRVMAEQ
ncbi:hypothetical protein N7509_010728 [Penicillium cosmopolitanum]|uniref:Uncharacterized protein n=1 Tax=Penicillium cosmopolitanum TaxID=1131564 RepID=A0A9W9VRX2_9EURO|nr:uncharacterized protein N7509_010728 [Penicillium cosmopolitanum]KAJ5388187.1 hypothetical protein N7509_010728 [Penicillium cosmopolitanum]